MEAGSGSATLPEDGYSVSETCRRKDNGLFYVFTGILTAFSSENIMVF
jgi:hypothetical protein